MAVVMLVTAIFASPVLSYRDFSARAVSTYNDGASVVSEIADEKVSAADSRASANFTNLIVFARFADEDEFIDTVYDGTEVRRLIENTYTVGRYSVTDYYYSASDGNVRMQNLYLFDGNGSLQLSRPRGYYAEKTEQNPDGYESGEQGLRMVELREDWSAAVNAAIADGAKPTSFDGAERHELAELDKNNDGKIDAITVIYKNTTQDITVSWSSPLWNYQDYADYVSFDTDGKKITSGAYVQLTFTYEAAGKPTVYTDEDGVKFLSQSTAAHETGHIFGLKDLYRSASESGIYFMSLMAKHLSPVGQFLSVREREAMGWLGRDRVKTLTGEGSYTLEVSASRVGGGTIGYKVDLPKFNKTLYLEYRSFKGTQNIFDSQATQILASDGSLLKRTNLKSGLVCYLVRSDMKVPSNLGTTGSNWNYEALGGTYSTKSDCALGEDEGLDIKYSDLYVEVTAMNDESVTFSITGEELRNAAHVHDMQCFAAVEPTCTADGNSEYYYCGGCGKYFADADGNRETTLAETVLPKTGHKPVIVHATEPTCTENGLTEGERCSVCGAVLKSQQTIEKLGHEPSEWIVDLAPTVTTEGRRHKECMRCHEILGEETLDKLPSKDDGDDKGDNNGDGGKDDGNGGGDKDDGSGDKDNNNGGSGNDDPGNAGDDNADNDGDNDIGNADTSDSGKSGCGGRNAALAVGFALAVAAFALKRS